MRIVLAVETLREWRGRGQAHAVGLAIPSRIAPDVAMSTTTWRAADNREVGGSSPPGPTTELPQLDGVSEPRVLSSLGLTKPTNHRSIT